ncbi:MAG: 50S ribosomal protein L10 [Patescibacteria group bacterium]
MAKTRQQKEEIVAGIVEDFRKMKAAAFSSISGFTMNQANELRTKAAESGAKVFIAKKTLLGLAAKEAELELQPSNLEGSILTAVSFDDEVSAAKLLYTLAKENEAISLVGGILEGKSLSADEVTRLAALPTKEQLLGQLVGTLNAPISGFANVLAGNIRGLVTVLGAINKNKVTG